MNADDYERGMDSQWRCADAEHLTDLYDSNQDARSEARYEDDPRAEPDTREVAEDTMRGGGAGSDAERSVEA